MSKAPGTPMGSTLKQRMVRCTAPATQQRSNIALFSHALPRSSTFCPVQSSLALCARVGATACFLSATPLLTLDALIHPPCSLAPPFLTLTLPSYTRPLITHSANALGLHAPPTPLLALIPRRRCSGTTSRRLCSAGRAAPRLRRQRSPRLRRAGCWVGRRAGRRARHARLAAATRPRPRLRWSTTT